MTETEIIDFNALNNCPVVIFTDNRESGGGNNANGIAAGEPLSGRAGFLWSEGSVRV